MAGRALRVRRGVPALALKRGYSFWVVGYFG